MDMRLFPIPREYFERTIKPMIEGDYIWKGRPPTISHYHVFCAILYILRTGCPWRDLPSCYGKWHPIYLRFKRGGDTGLWWRVLMKLQQGKKVTMNIVLADSTTMKIHRHGGGANGGPGPEASTAPA